MTGLRLSGSKGDAVLDECSGRHRSCHNAVSVSPVGREPGSAVIRGGGTMVPCKQV
jgi:hypothetical protein